MTAQQVDFSPRNAKTIGKIIRDKANGANGANGGLTLPELHFDLLILSFFRSVNGQSVSFSE